MVIIYRYKEQDTTSNHNKWGYKMELTFKHLRKMKKEEIEKLRFELAKRDNLIACRYIADFYKYCDKQVRVVKGRKVPLGTIGTLFWLSYYNYSKYTDYWGIYMTERCGIRDENGNIYFTSLENVELIVE